jgi:hypothetical protein
MKHSLAKIYNFSFSHLSIEVDLNNSKKLNVKWKLQKDRLYLNKIIVKFLKIHDLFKKIHYILEKFR